MILAAPAQMVADAGGVDVEAVQPRERAGEVADEGGRVSLANKVPIALPPTRSNAMQRLPTASASSSSQIGSGTDRPASHAARMIGYS